MKDVEVLEVIGKDVSMTRYRYKGQVSYMRTDLFAKATEDDFERKYNEDMRLVNEARKRLTVRQSKIDAMSDEDRRIMKNCDNAVRSRWEDEAETNNGKDE